MKRRRQRGLVEMDSGGNKGGKVSNQNPPTGYGRPATGPDFTKQPPQRGKVLPKVITGIVTDVANVITARK